MRLLQQYLKEKQTRFNFGTETKDSVSLCTVSCVLLQYGLWSFQTGGTKLERFLPQNQHKYSKEIFEF